MQKDRSNTMALDADERQRQMVETRAKMLAAPGSVKWANRFSVVCGLLMGGGVWYYAATGRASSPGLMYLQGAGIVFMFWAGGIGLYMRKKVWFLVVAIVSVLPIWGGSLRAFRLALTVLGLETGADKMETMRDIWAVGQILVAIGLYVALFWPATLKHVWEGEKEAVPAKVEDAGAGVSESMDRREGGE